MLSARCTPLTCAILVGSLSLFSLQPNASQAYDKYMEKMSRSKGNKNNAARQAIFKANLRAIQAINNNPARTHVVSLPTHHQLFQAFAHNLA
jgi:hypothetical protein